MAKRKARRKSSGSSAGSWVALAALALTTGLVVVFAGSSFFRAIQPAGDRPDLPARAASTKPLAAERAALKVEIWNGSGRSGAGQKVAEALRDGGFTVTEVKNADRPDYGTTLVVDRKGNPRAVREVVECVHGGIPLLMKSPGSAVDVRVVVGRDQEGLKLTP